MPSKSQQPSNAQTIKRQISNWPKGVLTGLAVGALVIGGGVLALGQACASIAWQHRDQIPVVARWFDKTEEHAQTVAKLVTHDRFKTPVYVSIYNGGPNKEIQKFEMRLTGWNELSGELTDLKTQNKGVLHGYVRAGTLVLDYGSEADDRPGFGTLILREKHSPTAKMASSFFGVAMVHHCECKEGVVYSGPVEIVSAALTNEAILSGEIETKLRFREPQRVDPDYFPKMEMKEAEAN